ncbi:UNVERIFIED_CONTAM: hypothetical protein GTU68_064731 [Idotea baltica]|nr:hypothetical protein [Idotea baltica]
MPAYDALYNFSDRIRHILVRHEQGASHAAQGYARITGTAGVCIATSGPGATNLVTGIADAMLDSVPMVCITGQVFASLLGTDAFQETDIIGITIPITKWNHQVTEAEDIPEAIAKAFYIAQNGRPGPVLIDITKNAQIDSFDFRPAKIHSIPNFICEPAVQDEELTTATKAINACKKPLMLVGHGVLISEASKEVLELSEKASIPMACTLHGLSAVPTKHKNYVGMLGMHGNYAPNKLTNEADLILAVGMRFDDRVTGKLSEYAPTATIVHIDIDKAELHKIKHAHFPVLADAKEALEKMLPNIENRSRDEWFARFTELREEENKQVIDSDTKPSSGGIKMGEVIKGLSEATEGKAILVADVGQHQMASARYYEFQTPDSWITSGGLGTMGFALPAAMGAKVAAPDRTVLTVIGDGCFQMTFQELGTIAQENLDIKMIILNNNFLGMVRQWQEMFFEKRYSFTELDNPDFIKLADAFGIPGNRVGSRENLDESIQQMLKHKGPFLLEVTVEKEQNVFPMVESGSSVANIRLK